MRLKGLLKRRKKKKKGPPVSIFLCDEMRRCLFLVRGRVGGRVGGREEGGTSCIFLTLSGSGTPHPSTHGGGGLRGSCSGDIIMSHFTRVLPSISPRININHLPPSFPSLPSSRPSSPIHQHNNPFVSSSFFAAVARR